MNMNKYKNGNNMIITDKPIYPPYVKNYKYTPNG